MSGCCLKESLSLFFYYYLNLDSSFLCLLKYEKAHFALETNLFVYDFPSVIFEMGLILTSFYF